MEPSRQMTAERVWQWYCRSDDNRRTSGAYENVRLAHRFYQGDQWRGVDAEGQNLPFYNFIHFGGKKGITFHVCMELPFFHGGKRSF